MVVTAPDEQPEIKVIDELAALINARNATLHTGTPRMGKSANFRIWLDEAPMIQRPALDELSRAAFESGEPQ